MWRNRLILLQILFKVGLELCLWERGCTDDYGLDGRVLFLSRARLLLGNVRDPYRLIRLHRPNEAIVFEEGASSVLRTYRSLLQHRHLLYRPVLIVLLRAHELINDTERGHIILCWIYCVVFDRQSSITRAGPVLI